MTKTEEALNRAHRHLNLSKLVSLCCVAAVLFIVNTDLLATKIRYGAVAVLLTIGLLAFVIGIRCVFVIPQLERTALRESTMVSPLDPSVQSGRGRGEA
jgi:predicted lysophospholipase L1 biosynthesis ABC-type transport system permease subunit